MDIKLNFINQSNDQNNSEVVIFARNAAIDLDELAVAWTVIRNCGRGSHHPFTYPMENQIGCSDSWGNYTPLMNAEPGQQFEMVRTNSGDELQLSPQSAASPTEIELLNNLVQGAVNAFIYKDGRVFATRTGIVPGEKAAFAFKPTLWIGVVAEVTEGYVMNAAILSQINTELSLLGIASADIVMTGGGTGPSATPFSFNLQNIVMA